MDPATLIAIFQAGSALLQDAPELISTVEQDIKDFGVGTIDAAELQARWSAMNTALTAAKAKWQNAPSA